MKVKNVLKKIKFPIDEFELWQLRDSKQWTDRYTTLNDWDEIYKMLQIENKKEVMIDFHPIQSLPYNGGRKGVIVDIDFVIGSEYDLYKYKEMCNEVLDTSADPYCDYGMFTAIGFVQKNRRVYLNYIDYKKAEEG